MISLDNLEDLLVEKGLVSLNEFEISEYVETILKAGGFGKEFYIFGKELPLFVNSNWKIIEERILNSGGKVKIATYEKPRLPNFLKKENILYNLLDSIEIYALNKRPSGMSCLFYDDYEVLSKNGERFFLRGGVNEKEIQGYMNFFEKSKEKLKKADILGCFL